MFGFRHGRLGSAGTRTLIQRAIASLRARGTDAHLWLPGVGTLNGLTTGNYLESTGNTLATVDNPTGLVLDALGTVGASISLSAGLWTPELSASITSNSTTSMTFNASVAADAYQTASSGLLAAAGVVVGDFVDITYTISGYVSGSACAISGYASVKNYVSANGTYTARMKVTGSIDIYVYCTASTTLTVTINSINKLSGIHLTQGTTANKPVLRRGLTNLLTYSSDFSQSAWVAGGTASKANSTTVNTPAINDYVFQSLGPAANYAGKQITVAFSLSGTGTTAIGSYDNVSGFQSDPITLTATETIYTKTLTIGAGAVDVRALVGRITAGTATSFTSTIRGAFLGSYTAAQILAAGGIPVTTTAAASNPDAGRYSWSFDGSNDSLALSAPLFQMGDDHAVIAGLTPATNASDGYAFNPANGAATQMVGCLLVTPAGYAKAAWWDNASLIAITDNVGRANTSFVATAVKATNAKRLRVNGAQSGATENTAMGATTVTGGSIGTYASAGGNKYLGSIGALIAIKGTVTDAELLMYERLVAALTPGAPTF